MFVEVWLLALLFVVLAAAGFWAGRATSSGHREAGELKETLEATREELGQVRQEVNGHFEQSAQLFGSLAEDYRALYDHFSETARQLGFSESETEGLLEQADRNLLESGSRAEGSQKESAEKSGEKSDGPDDEAPRAREAKG